MTKINLVLTGAYAGKTIVLNGTKFIDGKHMLIGNLNKFEHLVKYFKFYGAFLEGSEELKAAQAADAERNGTNVSSDLQTNQGQADDSVRADQPSAAEVANGDGSDGATHSESESERAENSTLAAGANVTGGSYAVTETSPKIVKLRRILLDMNGNDDEQWNDAGLPKLSVVEKAYGAAGVTRDELHEAVPGWDREAAKGAASVI